MLEGRVHSHILGRQFIIVDCWSLCWGVLYVLLGDVQTVAGN